MSLGARILRFFFAKDEEARMEMRMNIARATAHAEDLNRTVRIDADAIRAAVLRCRETQPRVNRLRAIK